MNVLDVPVGGKPAGADAVCITANVTPVEIGLMPARPSGKPLRAYAKPVRAGHRFSGADTVSICAKAVPTEVGMLMRANVTSVETDATRVRSGGTPAGI